MADLSKSYIKRELTQIKEAGRVLRDPGTTSSWKSPLDSSRSVAAAAALDFPATTNGGEGGSSIRGKEKKAFLYNWKIQKSSMGRFSDSFEGFTLRSPEDVKRRNTAADGRSSKRARSFALKLTVEGRRWVGLLDRVNWVERFEKGWRLSDHEASKTDVMRPYRNAP